MSEKLAVKHKDSLILKESKSLQEKNRGRSLLSKLLWCDLLLFPFITCTIFLCYWFILCPLLFESLRSTYATTHGKSWPMLWLFLYWLIALLIWLIIMLLLILIWKRCKSRENKRTLMKSYGSSCSVGPSYSGNIKQSYFPRTSDTVDVENDGQKDQNRGETKRKDLPPLVIHRRTSGNDGGGSSAAKTQEKLIQEKEEEEEEEEIKTTVPSRESMKDYLKLVTVTPSEEEPETAKSPKSPLSPRDLFFIDLIREAEKAESRKSQERKSLEGKHFFPKDFTPTLQEEPQKNEDKATKDDRESKGEASYFIANIGSPLSEKTEVFLEIKPEAEEAKEWTVDLGKEKPILILDDANKPNDAPADSTDPSGPDFGMFQI